jgi:GTP1/Obg family GTP-binding protein
LRDRIKNINDDNSLESDYVEMNKNLDKIKLFIDDSKNTHKLTVEEQEEIQNKIKSSFEDLEKVIVILENKVKNLKIEQTKLKNRIATIAGSCVVGGLLTGITLT